jgi:predicted nucleic-acid-binding Zn-ribbon protein
MALIPINEKEACPKCAGTVLEIKYQFKKQTGFQYFDEDELAKLPTENEWLKLTCVRCSFTFNRATLA